jgi:hypothetical protein
MGVRGIDEITETLNFVVQRSHFDLMKAKYVLSF